MWRDGEASVGVKEAMRVKRVLSVGVHRSTMFRCYTGFEMDTMTSCLANGR